MVATILFTAWRLRHHWLNLYDQVICCACWKPRMHRHGTGLVHGGERMFRHILLIKNNSIFVNHFQWYWIRHVFYWFISLIILKVCFFLLSQDFCIQRLHLFYTPFFHQPQENNWESGCQDSVKLNSKVKESLVILVKLFVKVDIYILLPRCIWSFYSVDSLI